ncbi:MAG: HPr family phosphocarrier protein [Alphaproteobacteria bacterium]|nr:HPr family phosphocarrier protein [Alphaproteobacteria bacterium]
MNDQEFLVEILTISNKKGLHARAASLFVKQVEQFDAKVWVEKDGQRVSGNSIMGLMMLAAAKGTQIKVLAGGNQAKEVSASLSALVNDKFHEEE